MKIIRKTNELKNIIHSLKESNKSIGLVLTMGNIHEGHISLIKEAKENNDFVLSTIFINPTQFNNQNDYNSYPKTLNEDIEKLQSINCDLLFIPDVYEVYQNSIIKEITIKKYRNILCDKFRQGHFDGVTTVVDKFFTIIKPNKSYFGEKDFQQLKFIIELTKVKNYKIDIIPCPSIRDHYGMSLASRNSNFKEEHFKTFKQMAEIFNNFINLYNKKNIKINFEKLKSDLLKINIKNIDYLEIRDENNLELTKDYSKARLFIALYIDHIRIIDNFKLY